MKKIERLLKLRQELADYGQVFMVQAINYELARLARKLKIDYYSLG